MKYYAQFQPEALENNQIVPAQPAKTYVWDITEYFEGLTPEEQEELLNGGTEAREKVRTLSDSPEEVKSWEGPYSIQIDSVLICDTLPKGVSRVYISRFTETAILPVKADGGCSGYDLFADIEAPYHLEPGQIVLIGTGLNISMPYGMEAQIRSRSGLAAKNGVFVLNSPGTVDASYCGNGPDYEIRVVLANFGKKSFEIRPGMRIAQMVFCSLPSISLEEKVWEADNLVRSGGFGSTGV